MGDMRKLTEEGDLKITWDPHKAKEVEAARAAFQAAMDKGFVAFESKGRGKGKRLDFFDPQAKSVLLIPMVAGGAS